MYSEQKFWVIYQFNNMRQGMLIQVRGNRFIWNAVFIEHKLQSENKENSENIAPQGYSGLNIAV